MASEVPPINTCASLSDTEQNGFGHGLFDEEDETEYTRWKAPGDAVQPENTERAALAFALTPPPAPSAPRGSAAGPGACLRKAEVLAAPANSAVAAHVQHSKTSVNLLEFNRTPGALYHELLSADRVLLKCKHELQRKGLQKTEGDPRKLNSQRGVMVFAPPNMYEAALHALDSDQYQNLNCKHAFVADCYLEAVLGAVRRVGQNVYEKTAKRKTIDLYRFLVQHNLMHEHDGSISSKAFTAPPLLA